MRVRNGIMKSLGAMGRGPGHEHKVVPLVPANMEHFRESDFLWMDLDETCWKPIRSLRTI